MSNRRLISAALIAGALFAVAYLATSVLQDWINLDDAGARASRNPSQKSTSAAERGESTQSKNASSPKAEQSNSSNDANPRSPSGDTVEGIPLAGSDDWWLRLPRNPKGWLASGACTRAPIIRSPEVYVRSHDLNPRDSRLTSEDFSKLERLVSEWDEELLRLREARTEAAFKGISQMVDDGDLKESSFASFSKEQKKQFRSELAFSRRKLALQDDAADEDPDAEKARRLAMINSLGKQFGIVQERRGRFFAARVEDIPSAQEADAVFRDRLGGLWIVVVGFMVDHGALNAAEASELAFEVYRSLKLD